jgi:hypothetical protein
MKTWNTEVLVALGDADEFLYSVKSPKTGKMLSMSKDFVPPHLVKPIETAVFFANNQTTGYGKANLTLEDFRIWMAAHEEYVAEMLRVDDYEGETEPYEVRFGPRDESF